MGIVGLAHVGVVTADLDRAVRIWSDRYGVGPWRFWTYRDERVTARAFGDPIPVAIRIARCGLADGTAVELLQPLTGDGPFAASLAAHGGADHLHHVKLAVDDAVGVSARLDALGRERSLDARFTGAGAGTARSAYFETQEELGFRLEVGDHPADFRPTAPEATYPSER